MKSRTKIVIGFAIGFLLLFLLVFGVGWENLLKTLVSVNPYWLLISTGTAFMAIFMWSICWNYILRASGKEIAIKDLFPIFLSGVFANNITPLGQAGGEAAIAYVLSSKSDVDYEESFATILVTDILNLLPFLLFAIIGLSVIIVSFDITMRGISIALGGIGASIMILFLFYTLVTKKEFFEKITLFFTNRICKALDFLSEKWERKLSEENVKKKIDGFYSSFQVMRDNKNRLVQALFFSFAGWLLMVLSIHFIFVSLGLNISLVMAFFVVAITSFVSFTPLPGGTGGVEIAITLFLSTMIGLTLGESSSIAILYRFVTYWIPLIVGALISVLLLKSRKISAKVMMEKESI